MCCVLLLQLFIHTHQYSTLHQYNIIFNMYPTPYHVPLAIHAIDHVTDTQSETNHRQGGGGSILTVPDRHVAHATIVM